MLIDLHFFVPSLFQLVLSLHFSVEIWTVRWWLNIMICFKFCWDFCLPGLYHTVTWLFSAWVFHWWAHPGHIFIMSRTSEMDYQTWTISVSWKQVGPLTRMRGVYKRCWVTPAPAGRPPRPPIWEMCTSAAGWPLPPAGRPAGPTVWEVCTSAALHISLGCQHSIGRPTYSGHMLIMSWTSQPIQSPWAEPSHLLVALFTTCSRFVVGFVVGF